MAGLILFMLCILGHSFDVAGSRQNAGDIYSLKLETFGHLYLGTINVQCIDVGGINNKFKDDTQIVAFAIARRIVLNNI